MTVLANLMPGQGPVAAIPIRVPPVMVGNCPVKMGAAHDERPMG
ncbi:hypothetical protein ACQPW3_25055 [Actinosynnema sp. CA-248983]